MAVVDHEIGVDDAHPAQKADRPLGIGLLQHVVDHERQHAGLTALGELVAELEVELPARVAVQIEAGAADVEGGRRHDALEERARAEPHRDCREREEGPAAGIEDVHAERLQIERAPPAAPRHDRVLEPQPDIAVGSGERLLDIGGKEIERDRPRREAPRRRGHQDRDAGHQRAEHLDEEFCRAPDH